jgi:nucleoside-diphosphate-sugar epimerase
MKNGPILITGGTGFIGAEIVRMLLAAGEEEIHVLHRRGNFQRLQDVLERVNPIQIDLADGPRLGDVVADTRPRAIYHLGAILTGPGEENPQAATIANAFGTYALLEAARRHEVNQFLFASSVGVYGAGITEDVITDLTLQRPFTIYGITKVFGEQMGSYYKQKYGLDFRGLRYPSIVGPGVTTPSVVQFTSWVIEECARGNPFSITVTPETAVPVMYYKDAARAMIQLGAAPDEAIKTVNYLVDGVKPTPTADQLAESVRKRISGAQITFEPNAIMQAVIDQAIRPLDDHRARDEWNWQPAYDQEAIVHDFLLELRDHQERYR